ncbi:transposase family protein [Streptomyces atriruber]|uniref:transposase family protein n=1 Tax=Streptomyces atriruber TaxID=545121 RepID=UPI000A42E1AB|nr:transposase family protein [Streptomyces atriruber]
MRDSLALGDTVRYRGTTWEIIAFCGPRVYLERPGQAAADPLVILQRALTAAPDFAVVSRPAQRTVVPMRVGELTGLPRRLRKEAKRWERHVKEVLHEQAPWIPADTPAVPAFAPALRTLKERYQAKADQLTALGHQVSSATVERKCAAWRAGGLMGLVDKRSLRGGSLAGRLDAKVIDLVWEVLDDERKAGRSPGTLSRLIDDVKRLVISRYAVNGTVPKTFRCSQATWYRLLAGLSITAENAHAVAAARSAGSAHTAGWHDGRPATLARWPGELVQIDTTGLDVLAMGDDGRVISVELTIAIDVATRSIIGALVVPKRHRRGDGHGRWIAGRATRSFDTVQVLGQALAPLPARPGWGPQTLMEGSALPYEELLAADERFAGSAARPVIKPHTMVIDHGSPYISEDFTRACLSLGIQVRKARLRTAIDKAIVERAMRAVKTGFSQYLASYTHHRLDLRGKKVRKQLVWTIPQLQDLFEQWVVLHWQQTPHGGLRSPFRPGVKVSPNAMYAALVAMRGYRRINLTETQTRKLLPAWYVRVDRKGFQINNRTYNLQKGGLDAFREPSGIAWLKGRWEVHCSPNNPEFAWLFDRRAEERGKDPWVEVPFIHRRLLEDGWTEEAWAEAERIHNAQGGSTRDEAAITRVLAKLQRTLAAGPQPGTAPPAPAAAARQQPRTLASPVDTGADLPPLDIESVRPFRSLDRPARDLFDTPEPVRGGGQSLEDFLASLPQSPPVDPPGDSDSTPPPDDPETLPGECS